MIILFLLFISMNYAPNQNEKVVEETLASFNSDAVKTILFQNDPPSLASYSKIFTYFSFTLSQTVESITNGSVS